MNELLTLYAEILQAAGAVIQDDYVMIQKGDKLVNLQLKINNTLRKVVLPTPAKTKNGNWMEMVGFHPGLESVLPGASEILLLLKSLIGIKLATNIQILAATILDLKQNKKLVNSLSLEQTKLLAELDADNSTIELFSAIVKKTTLIVGAHPIITFKYEHDLVIDETKFARATKIIPHVLEGDTILGIKSSKKAVENMQKIYAKLLPEKFIFGSNHSKHAYLSSMLDCFVACAAVQNEIITILGKHTAIEVIDTSWTKGIPKLTTLCATYAPHALEGNKGRAETPKTVTPEKPNHDGPSMFSNTPSFNNRQHQAPTISAAINNGGYGINSNNGPIPLAAAFKSSIAGGYSHRQPISLSSAIQSPLVPAGGMASLGAGATFGGTTNTLGLFNQSGMSGLGGGALAQRGDLLSLLGGRQQSMFGAPLLSGLFANSR
jgi:hypothetical protein